MQFTATFVTYQNENDTILLGFADSEFDTTNFLLLQRTLEPAQQDVALGLAGLHIQFNERFAYGKVESASLRSGGLTLRLDQATAAAISNGEDIEIKFAFPELRIRELESQLRSLIEADQFDIEKR
jgi:hypothetical protein